MAINTSTVVLLVILAFLIYVFTSGTECFADVNSMETSSPSQSYDNMLSQQLQASQNAMAMGQQSAQASQSELLRDDAPQLQSQLQTQSQMQSLAQSQTQSQDRTGDAVPNVFDYQGITDSGMLNVADIDTAFGTPLPPNTNPNVVDTNKNNVENYDVSKLLPQENNPDWFDVPDGKYNLDNDKLINTDRYVIGVNTVGQSLKNASYDIRGTIPNPKFTVSPWNNSTYEPDYNIKPMC